MPSTANPDNADRPVMMGDTRTRLMQAALQTVREAGLSHASARTIATRAGANQALIFYHFHTVSELLEAASNNAVEDSVQRYRAAFATVGSLGDLLTVGRQLHEREREIGNVAFMAQMMSGAQHDPVLARATRYAMSTWIHEVHLALDHVLRGSAVAELVDTDGLAHLFAAGFIGLELYDDVDHAGASRALSTLEALAPLIETLNSIGPISRRVLRTATQRHQ